MGHGRNTDRSSSRPLSEPAPWTRASDVVLGARGRLSGQVLDANGKAQVAVAVNIEQSGKIIATTKTDKAGRFGVDDVRGGVCNIHVDGMASTFRCWTADAAPPSAKPEVLVISDPQFARGQRPIGDILTNPLLIGAVLAAAIAIPIAIHNAQNNGPGS